MSKSWDSRTPRTAGHQAGSRAIGIFDHRTADLQAAANLNPGPQHLQTLQGLFEASPDPLQKQGEEEELQMMQQQEAEEEDLMQGKADGAMAPESANGLPRQLQAGVEALSGTSVADVQVHKNSGKPAAVGAHAFAQGTDIHLGPGQEKHLPHEAWHVVQQKQGRVAPTMTLGDGTPVNDNPALEKEADVMGAKALQGKWDSTRSAR